MTNSRVSTVKDERGFAIVIAIFVLATLISVTAAALRMGQADIVASRNYRSGSQALYAAQAGVVHAMMIVNAGGTGGVTNLQNDAINGWSGTWGGAKTMPTVTSYSYNVTLVQDAVLYPGDVDRGVLTSTATGSDNSTRTIVAHVRRSGIPAAPAGALYLATDNNTNSTFNGNAFSIDGNDWNMNNTAGTAAAIPGITTRNDTNSTETRDSLSAEQKDNVTGLGFVPGNPPTPSVATAQGMSAAQINQMVTDLLQMPYTPHDYDINGNDNTLGDCSAGGGGPKITYLGPGNGSPYKENGTASGCGVMIIESGVTINGNFRFDGLVIVRGTTKITDVTGNMTLHGSLWTTDVNFRDGGSSDIRFSSQALALANQAGGLPGTLPAPIVVTAWRDVF